MWAREAGHYADIKVKAHQIFLDTGMFAYVGKRVGLAAIGFFEGAADAALGLIDTGAGLVGVHPGLVEWNTKQYDKIKGGYSELSGIDHTLVSDDEIGRFGGKIAGGLAFGRAIGKAAQGGNVTAQLLMVTQVGGGIRATVDTIRTLRAADKTWGEIFSDPAVVTQVAGAVVGAAGIGASAMPALSDFFKQAGLVATAAQLSGMTATLVKIQMNPRLSEEEKYKLTLDATANLIIAVGLTADRELGPRPGAQPATGPRPAGQARAGTIGERAGPDGTGAGHARAPKPLPPMPRPAGAGGETCRRRAFRLLGRRAGTGPAGRRPSAVASRRRQLRAVPTGRESPTALGRPGNRTMPRSASATRPPRPGPRRRSRRRGRHR